MSQSPNGHGRDHSERVMLYLLQALAAGEALAFEAHLEKCSECRQQIEALGPVADGSDAHRQSAVLRPTAPLWERLASRLAEDTGQTAPTVFEDNWKEPEWKEGLPGLSVQVLSRDADAHRVTMLVRLEPGIEYPPHTHAGLEELYVLDGAVWINERELHPGDYNRAEAGTSDERVWSEIGCTCLLITSHRDILQ